MSNNPLSEFIATFSPGAFIPDNMPDETPDEDWEPAIAPPAEPPQEEKALPKREYSRLRLKR